MIECQQKFLNDRTEIEAQNLKPKRGLYRWLDIERGRERRGCSYEQKEGEKERESDRLGAGLGSGGGSSTPFHPQRKKERKGDIHMYIYIYMYIEGM